LLPGLGGAAFFTTRVFPWASAFADRFPVSVAATPPRTPNSRLVFSSEPNCTQKLAAFVTTFCDEDAATFEQPSAQFVTEHHGCPTSV
jgi:hypothetical protein